VDGLGAGSAELCGVASQHRFRVPTRLPAVSGVHAAERVGPRIDAEEGG
jgi:hypothetical protein